MSPAPAVTNILEMTQLSPQFKFCKEQFITLRLKVRIKVENLEDESWWQLISLLCNLHESSVKSYDFLNRNNPCHTVCSMCNFLSPVYFDFRASKLHTSSLRRQHHWKRLNLILTTKCWGFLLRKTQFSLE